MSESQIERLRKNAEPYKVWIRLALMAICLINVGYNVMVFKDNIRFEAHDLDIIDITKGIKTQDDIFNVSVNNRPLASSYVVDHSTDHEFERDKAILNIIFSLFVFTLLRYGKGINDEK